jgi:hypothetical protein
MSDLAKHQRQHGGPACIGPLDGRGPIVSDSYGYDVTFERVSAVDYLWVPVLTVWLADFVSPAVIFVRVELS